MSAPAMEIPPESIAKEPATALSRVDLPEPFVPIMTTKDPSDTSRLISHKARNSFGVPGLKVLPILRTSSMRWPGPADFQLPEKLRSYECEKYKQCGD